MRARASFLRLPQGSKSKIGESTENATLFSSLNSPDKSVQRNKGGLCFFSPREQAHVSQCWGRRGMGVKEKKKKNNASLHGHEGGAPARASLMKAFSLMWRLWVPLNTLRDRR